MSKLYLQNSFKTYKLNLKSKTVKMLKRLELILKTPSIKKTLQETMNTKRSLLNLRPKEKYLNQNRILKSKPKKEFYLRKNSKLTKKREKLKT